MIITIGIVMGLVSGLLPGVGNLTLMMLLFPFLNYFDPIDLLVIYISMASISQYIGSIPAICFGIPGEPSSLPAVSESKNLKNSNEVAQAIFGSAFGSFIGGVLILCACLLLSDYIYLIKYFYSTYLISALLIITAIVLCFTATNTLIINFIMLFIGIGLGLVGYNKTFNIDILSFDSMYLFSGLPLEVVLVSLFAIPQVLSAFSTRDLTFHMIESVKLYTVRPINTIISTIIGFFAGLVPGLTTELSSLMAYSLATLRRFSPIDKIIASETANNAGAFSQTLPLLIFGIPLIGSQALLLTLLEQKGFFINFIDFSTLMPTLSISLLIVNAFGLFIAWIGAKYLLYVYAINIKTLLSFILVLLFTAICYSGYANYTLTYYIVVFVILLPFSIYLKRYNTMPLVYGFITHDIIIDNINRLFYLL